jgi:hypothetical protein
MTEVVSPPTGAVPKVKLTGDTMTGGLTVAPASGTAEITVESATTTAAINLKSPSASSCNYLFYEGGFLRASLQWLATSDIVRCLAYDTAGTNMQRAWGYEYGAALDLYYNGVSVAETTATGFSVTGVMTDSRQSRTLTNNDAFTIDDNVSVFTTITTALRDNISITMPANPVAGQRMQMSFRGQITNLQILPNAGQAIRPAATPTAMPADSSVEWWWNSTQTTWYLTTPPHTKPVQDVTNLSFTSNALKVLRVNAGETALELASPSEAFPVGSVFIGVVPTNPATLLGYGTWSAIAAGRVLVGLDSGDTDFDTVEETGGAKTVAAAGTVAAPTMSGSTAAEASHTHTYTDVVNHTHTVNVNDPGHVHAISTGTTDGAVGRVDSSSSAEAATFDTNSATTGITATTDNPAGGVATGTTAAGSSHSHGAGTLAASAPAFTGSATSVVQPYFVVYMWKRTA